jgi:arsenical-resistance protein 2
MAEEKPWYSAFTAPKSTPGSISKEEVLTLLKMQRPGRDFLLVDVRRNDHEV